MSSEGFENLNEANMPDYSKFSPIPDYYTKSILRKTSQIFSLIFPLASTCFDIVMAYNAYNLFIDNQVLLTLLTGFSVLPNLGISCYVITQASGDLFDKIYSCRSKISSSGYFPTFYPKTNIASIIISFLLGVVDAPGGFYIISDNLDKSFLKPVKYIVAGLAVVGGLTFGTYTLYSTFINFGETIKKKCDSGASYILNCIKKFGEVRDSIINTSSDLVESFINEVNPQGYEFG